MGRKRHKPYTTNNDHQTPKRRRPFHPAAEEEVADKPTAKAAPPPALIVTGLSPECSVLDLKSRFEIYGSISRIRIDKDSVGIVSFRTRHSAEAAIAASLDPSFGLTVQSRKVQVLWATDPLANWRQGVKSGSASKLLRPEVPLSRHGRANKLSSSSDPREIVAYDDIL